MTPTPLTSDYVDCTRLARRAVSDARCVISDLREEALVDEVRSVATAWGVFTGVNVILELAPRVRRPPGDG